MSFSVLIIKDIGLLVKTLNSPDTRLFNTFLQRATEDYKVLPKKKLIIFLNYVFNNLHQSNNQPTFLQWLLLLQVALPLGSVQL